MLRITVHDNPQALTFQLEGRLAGPWLRELEECWQSTLAHQRKPILRVDLTGVTFIDDAGKACLAAMHSPRGRIRCRRLPDKRHRGRDHPGRPFPRTANCTTTT